MLAWLWDDLVVDGVELFLDLVIIYQPVPIAVEVVKESRDFVVGEVLRLVSDHDVVVVPPDRVNRLCHAFQIQIQIQVVTKVALGYLIPAEKEEGMRVRVGGRQ